MEIRPAGPGDADAINSVYNLFIDNSPATFETEPWETDVREAWLRDREGDARYPAFLAFDGAGGPAGFASASPFDPRAGYADSVKTSVFVAPGRHGEGVGRALYQALFGALGRADLHRAYALIVIPNPASIALHRAFGFHEVGRLSEAGRKFGRRYCVAIYEKRL